MYTNRPTQKEIEEFFKEQETTSLPRVDFSVQNTVFSNNHFTKNISQTFPKDIGESLFKNKTKEGWNFDFSFRTIKQVTTIEVHAVLYNDGLIRQKMDGNGLSLEEIFIDLFGQEEFNNFYS